MVSVPYILPKERASFISSSQAISSHASGAPSAASNPLTTLQYNPSFATDLQYDRKEARARAKAERESLN